MPNGVIPPLPVPPNGWNRPGSLGILVPPDIAFWGRWPAGDLKVAILNPVKLVSCHPGFNYLYVAQYDFVPDAFTPAYNYQPIMQDTWDLAFALTHAIKCPDFCPTKTDIDMQYAEWDAIRRGAPPDQVYAVVIIRYKCVVIQQQQQQREPTPPPEPEPEQPPPGGIT